MSSVVRSDSSAAVSRNAVTPDTATHGQWTACARDELTRISSAQLIERRTHNTTRTDPSRRMNDAKSEDRRRLPGSEFVTGALAAAGAGFFTNPADVVKIRLQLQGELEARGSYKRIYKNTLHATYMIAKHEGILALQSGIVPAIGFQIVLNGIRLGGFNAAKNYELTLNSKGETDIIKTALVSGIAGSIGACLGSPFYMIKTQLQAQSAEAISVGFQHKHTGTWSAFKGLWKEGGVRALFRGWYASVPRIFVGGSTQLTTFALASDWLKSLNAFPDRPLTQTFFAALIAGNCVAITMQPLDVVATRLYNQGVDANGKGLLYSGFGDALIKVFRHEGLTGLYKGVFPTWIRIAPHTVLCLVFYKQIEQIFQRL